MTSPCQPHAPATVVVIAGVAGSGKSTLGRALARALGAAPLDLDTVTNPVLDGLGDLLPGGHWVGGEHRDRVREARYAALRATAAEVLAAGVGVVLVAPFTRELQGGADWQDLRRAVAPAEPTVLWIDGDPALLALRRAGRREVRDLHRIDEPAVPPTVPHTRIDALLDPRQQLSRGLLAVGVRAPVDPAHPVFAGTFDAVLSDLDGTLADSTAAVVRCWARLGAEFGFSTSAVHENHGRPAGALLGRMLPPEQVAAAASRVEALETADVADIRPTPGAVALLAALPAGRAAVVTSGRRPIAAARLAAAGLPVPAVVVTRDDVVHGKPDPEPFLLAAERLGVDPGRCLALEDAPAGIRSAKAAGCTVIAVRGTVGDDELAQADLVIDALDVLAATATDTGVRLLPAG